MGPGSARKCGTRPWAATTPWSSASGWPKPGGYRACCSGSGFGARVFRLRVAQPLPLGCGHQWRAASQADHVRFSIQALRRSVRQNAQGGVEGEGSAPGHCFHWQPFRPSGREASCQVRAAASSKSSKKAGAGKSTKKGPPKKTEVAAATPPPPRPARPTSSGKRSLTRALGLKISRIVIDPGHGGHDAGTIGPTGLMEKEVVMDVARRLGTLLEDRLGSEVVYTRRRTALSRWRNAPPSPTRSRPTCSSPFTPIPAAIAPFAALRPTI